MLRSIQCKKASHPNIVVEDFDKTVKHFGEVYGGSFMLDLPSENWHACLIEIGGLIIEFFVPKHFMLHGRVGPHYLGIEYEADMEEVRAAVADHGIRIMRDIGQAIHTDPFDGFGVDYEFFGGSFYGPNAPHVKTHTKSPECWANHPIGYTGMTAYTHAVIDIEEASAFLQSFLNAKPMYEVQRPALGARAIGLKIADTVCELISPVENGVLMQEMLATGHGIRSIVYGVNSVEQTRSYFIAAGMRVIDGTALGSIAVDPRDNLGIRFEFQEFA